MAWMQGLSVLLGGPGAAVWKAPRRGNRQGDNLGGKAKRFVLRMAYSGSILTCTHDHLVDVPIEFEDDEEKSKNFDNVQGYRRANHTGTCEVLPCYRIMV